MAYELQTGIDYDSAVTAEPVRAERFEVVTDLPDESLPWLIEQNLVVEVPDPEPEQLDPEPVKSSFKTSTSTARD